MTESPETPENRARCHGLFRSELARIWETSDPKPGGIVMPLLMFGEEYITRFARYCMPSLLAPGNMGPLAGRSRMLIYTTEANRQGVYDVTRPLHACGMDILIRTLPDSFTEKHLRYMTLGTVHQLGFHAAAHWRAGYHMLQPDHVFSDKFFTGLARLGAKHGAVGQTTISADVASIGSVLEYLKTDGVLAIPAKELGHLCWNHLHEMYPPFICNDMRIPDEAPPTTPHVWVSKDRLIIYNWHMNVDYVAPELVAQVPVPGAFTCYATIDSIWPYVCSRTPVQPTLEDEMICIELSGKEKVPRPSSASFMDYAVTAWHIVRFTDHYNSHIRCKSLFPIPEQEEGAYLTEQEIDERHEWLLRRTFAERQHIALLSIQDQAIKRGWRRPQ